MARARLIAWLATLTIAGTAAAQPPAAGGFTIESRPLRYAGGHAPEAQGNQRFPSADDIVMPWIRGGRPGAAMRINELVFLHELQLPAPREAGASFTPNAVESLDGFSHVRFDVARNDARVLVLAMGVEQCSNRCNLLDDTLLFDARTGHRLLLSDLVTPAGRVALLQRRKQAAIEAYQRAIDALPAPPAAKDTDDDAAPAAEPPPPPSERRHDADMPGDDEMRNFFASCQSTWETYGDTIDMPFDLPASGALRLRFEGCGSTPMMRALDESPADLDIPPSELAPLLTPYGRRVLFGDGVAEPPFTGWGQVLHGRVGEDAVTLYMDEPHGGWSNGTYVHDRIGRPIAVTGPAKGDMVELGEDGGKGFALRRVGGALVGTWNDKDQALPVRLR